MNPDAAGIPAQLAFNIIIGAFLVVSLYIAPRARRRVRRIGRTRIRGHRSRAADRPGGYATMRVRPPTPKPAADRHADTTRMDLAA